MNRKKRRTSAGAPYNKMSHRSMRRSVNAANAGSSRKSRPARSAQHSDGIRADWLHEARPLVSVIIPAMNESRTIASVVTQAHLVSSPVEVIVVDNGSKDGTGDLAAAAGARVLSYGQPLGHDIGRRIGAEAAKGEILLFLDADMVIPAALLQPFIRAVLKGADIALNDYSGPVRTRNVHPVVEAKHLLNMLLQRPDLRGASLTAVPHALSRTALQTLGYEVLERPPLAQAMAVMHGLKLSLAATVPVGRWNPRRTTRGVDPLQHIVVEDHKEAWRRLSEHRGPRMGYDAMQRLRHVDVIRS